ncbi:MAG TPA: hypothetical protein VFZ73_16035 [Gemmatimonadaceae bacterium]
MTILLGAAAIIAGTGLGLPVLAPVLTGVGIGLLRPRHAARYAALAALVAWGGLLLFALVRGDALARVASTLGAAMGVPAWALVVATLVYPALLASSAAWLAHLASPRRGATIQPAAGPST